MLKSFPALLVVVAVAFAPGARVAAQASPEASQQRPSESPLVCAPSTTATQETVTPLRTLTVYNPVAASTPSLTFYNPTAYPRPPLTFYTPLGQIDPPIRTSLPPTLPPVETPTPPPAETTPSAIPLQPSMPATQTIPAPGACPPGTQVERLTR
jgi:hypothetical protein